MRFAELFKAVFGAFDLSKFIALTAPGVVFALVIAFWVLPRPVFIDPGPLTTFRDSLRLERTVLVREIAEREKLAALSRARRSRDSLAIGLRLDLIEDYELGPGTSVSSAAIARDERAAFWRLIPQLDSLAGQLVASDTLRPATFPDGPDSARVVLLDSLIADANARLATQNRFDLAMDVLLESALLFILLGFLAGTLLNPLNKALMSARTKDLRLMRESAKADKEVQQAAPEPLPFLHAKKRGQGLNIPSEEPATRGLETESTEHRTIHWYIGKKVISEAEYDHAVAHYYRFAEITTGMTVPLAAAGVSVLVCVVFLGGPIPLSVAGAALIVLALGAWDLGVRRYDQFQVALRNLVLGRLEFQERERDETCLEKLDKVGEDIAKLAAAVEKLGEA